MDSKKPWQSKVIVVNAIMGLAAFAGLFLPQASAIPQFIQAHPAELALVWSIANMVLRAFKSNIVLGE